MLIEILSSAAVGGVAGYSWLKKRGQPTNDAEKIQRIFERANLTAAGEKVRLFRKSRPKGADYTEYVFQFPQGRSFKQLCDQKDVIEDGLNVKYSEVELRDLLALNWRKNPIPQIRKLFREPKVSRKEIDLDFDGMLRIRVFERPLTSSLPWTDECLRKDWRVPIGQSRTDFIEHDFEKRPHLLVAGSTGYGKSQFLKMLVTTLIMQKSDDVTFSLIDLKGGASFARFANAKQVERLARSPDEATHALDEITRAMNHKTEEIVTQGYEDVTEAGDPSRHFVVIDEAADLSDNKTAMQLITDIARKGRSAGYRLIYATQYPTTETIPSQVKRNIVTRLSYVLDTDTASRAVLDEGGAEKLPEIPGRAIYKRLRKTTVQCPRITNAEINVRIRGNLRYEPATNSSAGTSRKHTIEFERS